MAGIQELGGSYRILGRLTCSPWRCEFAEGLGDLCQRIIGHHERVGQPHRIVVEHVRRRRPGSNCTAKISCNASSNLTSATTWPVWMLTTHTPQERSSSGRSVIGMPLKMALSRTCDKPTKASGPAKSSPRVKPGSVATSSYRPVAGSIVPQGHRIKIGELGRMANSAFGGKMHLCGTCSHLCTMFVVYLVVDNKYNVYVR